ncbi:MAG: PCYCGC motif-containing (lipo)protein [Thermoleophilia bacterium]
MSQKINKSFMPSGFVMALAAIITVGIIAGIAAGVMSRRGSSSADTIKLPDFALAATAPRGAPQAYQFALDRPDLLKQIPCYCGCAADGHTSNLDCFIKSRDGNDVVFDPHGSG